MKTKKFKKEQTVICNGYPGYIKAVCIDELDGMYVVCLDSGDVCVSGSELKADK